MTERIKKLTELTLSGKMYVEPVSTVLCDNPTESPEIEVDNLCKYIPI